MALHEEGRVRLQGWIDRNYSSRRECADALKTTEQYLSAVLAGKRSFGPKLQSRFDEIGGNWLYILTGKYPDQKRQQAEIIIEVENAKMVNLLRSKGITSVDEVEKMLEVYKVFKVMSEKSK